MKHTLLSVKEVALELVSYRVSKILRFDLERIQRIFLLKRLSRIARSRGARSPAKAGDAQQEGPRSVKRGHYPQG